MENGKTDAMAPKKNAAPAEAPKSLGATIQNVITKAVTSPTDGKIDFAQGVNHITGDPQQKSAKPAEPMQSLKAGYDMKPKSETYEDKEEVKEADEKEDEKMMKAQADIKKMNASVHKKDDMKEAEDKKSEMIKAEIEKMKKEMADKKDELKAQVDKEKEMNEGEMPKAALDALKKSLKKTLKRNLKTKRKKNLKLKKMMKKK